MVEVERQAGTDEIEVTPEMVDAGADEFFSNLDADGDLSATLSAYELVSRIMRAGLRGQKNPECRKGR